LNLASILHSWRWVHGQW